MEAKEKAKELVGKFSGYLPWYSQKDNLTKSKECAKIAVNEILKRNEPIQGKFWDYWESVLKEIDNI